MNQFIERKANQQIKNKESILQRLTINRKNSTSRQLLVSGNTEQQGNLSRGIVIWSGQSL